MQNEVLTMQQPSIKSSGHAGKRYIGLVQKLE